MGYVSGGRILMPIAFGFIIGCCLHLILFEWNFDHQLAPCQEVSSTEMNPVSDFFPPGDEQALELTSNDVDYDLKYVTPDVARQSDQPEPRKMPNRPRFLATELDIKDKLLVAVLSSRQSLTSLGFAANRTVAHHVSKLVVFVEGSTPLPFSHPINLVGIPDDSGIELPTALQALEYILEQPSFGSNYDWFYFATDRTYIRAVKLFELVTHMSVGYDVVLGSVENSCNVESGILMSRSAMGRLQKTLPLCKSSLEHRTMQGCLKLAGLICEERFMDKRLSTVKLPVGTTHVTKTLDRLAPGDLSQVAAVYPVTKPDTIMELHGYFTRLELAHVRQQYEGLEHDVARAIHDGTLPREGQESWPFSLQKHVSPKSRFEVLPWDTLTKNYVHVADSSSNIEPLKVSDHDDLAEIIHAAMVEINKSTGDTELSYSRLVSAHRRFDPSRGMEYLLDLEVEPGKEVRRVELIRPVSKTELIQVPYVSEEVHLTFIVPVRTPLEALAATNFSGNYEATCLAGRDSTRLLIFVSYGHSPEFDRAVRRLRAKVVECQNKYAERLGQRSGPKLELLITANPVEGPVRTAIETAIEKWGTDSMFFVTSPYGMSLKVDFINRIKMNSIREFQVFAPIPFRHFDPKIAGDVSRQEPHKDLGLFDSEDFGHVGFYGADYLACREVGNSAGDVDDVLSVFAKCTSRNLHVFRAPDPAFHLENRYDQCNVNDDDCLAQMGTKMQIVAKLENGG